MNIALFEPEEASATFLPLADPRVGHIRDTLRCKPGQTFDAGIIDGPRGKGKVVSWDGSGLSLSLAWERAVPELPPVVAIVGLCRPQTCRKILQEAAAIGLKRLLFATTARSEPSYAQSKLWTTREWRRHLIAGAAQAFTTRIPELRWGQPLEDALASAPSRAHLLALDNYEAPERLGKQDIGPLDTVCFAVGAERGWTADEKSLLRSSGYQLVHIGERPLRTETAVSVSLGLIRFMQSSTS